MNDTQWSRFQVFIQESPGSTFYDAGSIHAPDAELAMLNARDVFARRPMCTGIWVVPVSAIYSAAQDEISARNESETPRTDGPKEPYSIFCKTRSAGTLNYAGQLAARSPQEALHLAKDQFAPDRTVYLWWIFPANQVIGSTVEDIPSLFSPALTKAFRMPETFRTVSTMRTIRHSPDKGPPSPSS